MAEKAKVRSAAGTRRQSTTIRSVAERARVSIATVSHVMNQTRYVRPETRDRVVKAAADLGYAMIPNRKAQRHGPAGSLGLLLAPDLPRADDPLTLGTLAFHLFTVAAEEHYTVISEPMRRHRGHGLATPRIIAEQRVGGALVVGQLQKQDLAQMQDWAIPYCTFGEVDGLAGKVPTVRLNHHAGIRDSMQYLAALGHKRIAIVLPAANDPAHRPKRNGYLETVREFGLDPAPELITDLPGGHQSFTGGRHATLKLLEASRPPTAICYASDWVAIGGLRAADERGLRVPEQLSIVGFNDSFLARETEPALTTVQFDPADAARAAIDILRRQAGDRASSRNHVIEIRPRLVLRHSCAPVAGA